MCESWLDSNLRFHRGHWQSSSHSHKIHPWSLSRSCVNSMLMETKNQAINSKGSFYSAVNQREDAQIAGPWEEGGSIPWAGERYQMKSVSHSSPYRLLLFPSRRNKIEENKGLSRSLSCSLSFSHRHKCRHINIYSQRMEVRHNFCWWWESCLIIHCSGHVTKLLHTHTSTLKVPMRILCCFIQSNVKRFEHHSCQSKTNSDALSKTASEKYY